MVFQNAIRIATDSKDEFTFTSFWGTNRDACYDLIVRTRDRVVNELKPVAVGRRLRRPDSAGSSRSSTTGDRSAVLEAQHGPATPPAASPRSEGSARASSASEAVEAVVSPTQENETDTAASNDETTPVDATADANSGVTTEREPQQVTQLESAVQNNDASDSDLLHTPVRRSSVVSDIGSVAPKDISMTQLLEDTFDVSVDEFMAEFIWDGARFGTDAYGVSLGYTEMKCDPWVAPQEVDASFGASVCARVNGGRLFGSVVPNGADATTCCWRTGMTRSLQFRVPVDAPIGPKSSRVDVVRDTTDTATLCTATAMGIPCRLTESRLLFALHEQLQCAKRAEHNIQIIETSTRLVDIPYGDYFSVEDRWTLVPSQSHPKRCCLCIELKVGSDDLRDALAGNDSES